MIKSWIKTIFIVNLSLKQELRCCAISSIVYTGKKESILSN